MKHSDEPSSGRYVPVLGYDLLTSLYDPILALTTREQVFKRGLIRQADIRDGAEVLDLGCGTGSLAILVAMQVTEAGVDGDHKVLGVAHRKATAAGVRVDFDQHLPRRARNARESVLPHSQSRSTTIPRRKLPSVGSRSMPSTRAVNTGSGLTSPEAGGNGLRAGRRHSSPVLMRPTWRRCFRQVRHDSGLDNNRVI